jgi:formamidopyrimidine-DNA glycosylase
MPELPEVEAVARTLRPLVERRRIRCVHVLHPIATKPQSPSHLARTAEGQRIQSVQRKGKYLWLQLEHGIVTLHFKLDGQLIWFPNAEKMLRVANEKETGVHVDVAFELEMGVLGFADGRHFGRVYVYESEEACPALGGGRNIARFHTITLRQVAGEFATSSQRISTRSDPRRGYRQHLFLRNIVAREAGPAP